MNLRSSTDSPQLTSSQDYAPQFTEVAPYYDRLMSNVPYRMWVDYLELLFSMLGVKPRRIVDLACGTGNVTFELAKRGYEVVGVDASCAMIEVARKKCAQYQRDVEFIVSDLRGLQSILPPTAEREAGRHSSDLPQAGAGSGDVLPSSPARQSSDVTPRAAGRRGVGGEGWQFDVATCLYDSLNYLVEPADLRHAFASIREHVLPGGHFIFDTNSVYALEQELFTQNNLAWANTLRYHWKSHYDRATRISEVRMQFSVRDADGVVKEFNEVHRERAYELDEIQQYLRGANWDVLHVFDAYTMNRVRDDSERWFFVAQSS